MHSDVVSGVHHAPELHELVFNVEANIMQDLNINEIEKVSGGNMPESSVGGSSGWS
jgi:hypothetical protein